MKRSCLAILVLVISLQADAQQLTQYSHYLLNYFALNPAVAGSSPCLDLKAGYRNQWQGLPGAPTTAFANIHGNFGKKKNNFHGIGSSVEADDSGPLGFTAISFAYAFHMKVNAKYMLSTGVSAGVMQYRIDVGSITLPDVQAGNDPAFTGNSSVFVYPQINFGMWLYKDDRFYGFAIRNMVENQVDGVGLDTRLTRHYSFTAGRAIAMNDGFMFKPSAHLKYVASSRLALDMTAMMDYKEKFQFGMGFRSESGLVGLVKVDLFKYVTVAYGYDLALSKMRYGGRNTHEIVLGIKACSTDEVGRVPCAAYD